MEGHMQPKNRKARKLILYSALSRDGYIARENGAIDWLENPEWHLEGEDFGYQSFYESIGSTLMGAKTYEQVLGFDIPFPYAGKENFVFSRTDREPDGQVIFISRPIGAFVGELKQKPGGPIWLVGGGQINTILYKCNLIDEMILTYIPVQLGKGIPLIDHFDPESGYKVKTRTIYPNGFEQQILIRMDR